MVPFWKNNERRKLYQRQIPIVKNIEPEKPSLGEVVSGMKLKLESRIFGLDDPDKHSQGAVAFISVIIFIVTLFLTSYFWGG